MKNEKNGKKSPTLEVWQKMLLFCLISIVVCSVKQYVKDYALFISSIYMVIAACGAKI